MKEYLIVIVSIIIFLTIFEGVLPKGKHNKFIKTIISSIVVCILLVPIIKIFNSDYTFDAVSNNIDYENYLIDYKEKTIKNEIKTLLNSEKIVEKKIEVDCKENIVLIILDEAVINDKEEHINNKEKAKSLLIERLYLIDWELLIE